VEFDPSDTTVENSCPTASGETGHCEVGGQYGRYELLRRLGAGGMGEVSAFESALATYETWGAKALVARLREIGIEAI
jgi:hypothetical protein